MLLCDVNVLIQAHRAEFPLHHDYRVWLEQLANGHQPFALSDLVASAFVRIVTVLKPPTPLTTAFAFIDTLRALPHCRSLRPGPGHWAIFSDLCTRAQLRGSVISDAYHAALAIEHGCEWVSEDHDFARFPGLRWRSPLAVAKAAKSLVKPGPNKSR